MLLVEDPPYDTGSTGSLSTQSLSVLIRWPQSPPSPIQYHMAETRTFPIQELNYKGSFCEAFFPPGLLAIVAEFPSGDSWTKQATSVKWLLIE